jgi:aspartate racemase
MHKRIGIIGGLSPESTVGYYTHIFRRYIERFGDHSYPEIIIYSVSFENYGIWPEQERWDLIAEGLTAVARKLEAAGADFLVISANTMHMVLDQVRASVRIPVLSIMDAVADAILARGFNKVGLIGTKYTMGKGFYRDALAARGITAIIPEQQDRVYIDRVLYDELPNNIIRDESREGYIKIINKLAAQGAQGIILGCTEISMLVNQQHLELPVFDTNAIHAEAALNFALEGR